MLGSTRSSLLVPLVAHNHAIRPAIRRYVTRKNREEIRTRENIGALIKYAQAEEKCTNVRAALKREHEDAVLKLISALTNIEER